VREGTIAELWRYPVKSMGGGAVETVALTGQGVVGDRGYAIVDRSDGRVASAKQPRKWAALLHPEARYVDEPVAGADPRRSRSHSPTALGYAATRPAPTPRCPGTPLATWR